MAEDVFFFNHIVKSRKEQAAFDDTGKTFQRYNVPTCHQEDFKFKFSNPAFRATLSASTFLIYRKHASIFPSLLLLVPRSLSIKTMLAIIS